MIRLLHRDGLVLELTAGGDRPTQAPLHFPDALAARRLLVTTTTDAVGMQVARELLAAAGEPSVSGLEASAALDRLAIALAVGRVKAAIARPRLRTDNVAPPPLPASAPSVVAPPHSPGVTRAPSAAATVAAAAAATAAAVVAPTTPAVVSEPYPEPEMTDIEQAAYANLSPAAKTLFDQALDIARNGDITSTGVIFWSKGTDKLAARWAEQHGFKSLESTPGGSALDTLYNRADVKMWDDATRSAAAQEIASANLTMIPWAIISARYGSQANGRVYAFVTKQTRPNSVFFRVELPRALARGVTIIPATPVVASTGRVVLSEIHPAVDRDHPGFQHLEADPAAQNAADFYRNYPRHPNPEQRAAYSALTRHYDGRFSTTPLTADERQTVDRILNAPRPPTGSPP